MAVSDLLALLQISHCSSERKGNQSCRNSASRQRWSFAMSPTELH